jgi:hypothetical protein
MDLKAPILLTGLARWWNTKRVTTIADFECMAMVLLSGKGEASNAPGPRACSPLSARCRRRALPLLRALATRFGPDLEAVQLYDRIPAGTQPDAAVWRMPRSPGARS